MNLFTLCQDSIAEVRRFKQDMSDLKWEVTSSPLKCGLTQVIDNYGVASIHQRNGRPQSFTLESFLPVSRPGKADFLIAPPPWKPYEDSYYVSSMRLHLGNRPIRFGLKLSRIMLARLQEGKVPRFRYRTIEGDRIFVDLSPVNFQESYERYVQCVAHLLPFTFDEVKHIDIFYDVNQTQLPNTAKRTLNKISQYIRADNKVKQIIIAGYTDDSGLHALNNTVSQRRAVAVKDYLLERGVARKQIRVTWYGKRRPHTSNDTMEGKSQNRRVTVRMIR